MQIKYLRVKSLVPYARNARTHSDEQVAQVAASIREFGFLNPVIVDGGQGIIAGHCRVMAARQLGMDEVPCVEASHLTDTQKRAFILADNRLALGAGWDEEMLRLELEELQSLEFDIGLTGFDVAELEKVSLGDAVNFSPGTQDEQGELDRIEPKLCPHCGGQL